MKIRTTSKYGRATRRAFGARLPMSGVRRRSGAASELLEPRMLLSGYTFSTVAPFGNNGRFPESNMIEVGGNLYGTTESGAGATDYGNIFEYNTTTKQLATLYAFNESIGLDPTAGLTELDSTHLVGTTEADGPGGDGTVFELNLATDTLTTLASFSGTNGNDPRGVLLLDNGNLYGTTYSGGSANDGIVFEYNLGSGALTTLATLHGTNGANPLAGLIDVGGNLYGTTYAGGSANDGTVFEYDTSTVYLSTIATFHGSNGSDPQASLIDVAGNLYGTTALGGTAADGTIFEYSFSTQLATTIATFHGSNGANPEASLIDVGGDLLGTTYVGGTDNYGTAFEYDFSTNTETPVVSFDATNGAYPEAGLNDVNGNLFGTTMSGDPAGGGTLFELTPSTSTLVSGTVATSSGVGIAGITVYLDANNNAILDSGELSTTTNSSGAYSFSNVPAGAYIVRQVLPPGTVQTSPADNHGNHITVTSGSSLTAENFTDAVASGGSISGSVKTASGAGVAGITVYLDANNNSRLDSGELSTATNSSGAYSFSNVPAGAYIVRQILPAADTQVTPAGNYGDHVTITNGGSLTGQNFIDAANTASISGTVFNDANGDGTQDNGETGLAGWTVYIDTNNDDQLDNGEISTTTNSNGNYSFTGLAAGTYIVRAIAKSGYHQTSPANGHGQHITVADGQAVTGASFGELT